MNNNKLTQRQKRFARYIFAGMSQRDAYIEVYKPTGTIEAIDSHASRLASNGKVLSRLAFLEKRVDDPLIMKERERRLIFSEIGRGDLTDFISEDGEPKLTKDTPNRRAAAEYSIRHSYSRDGDIMAVTKSIKLHNPIAPIDKLNLMDGTYAPEKHAVLGNFTIKVVYEHRDRIGAGNRSQAPDTT